MQKLLILLIGVVAGMPSRAQLQVGIFGGLSNYQGDLVDKPYQSSKAVFGLNAGYQVTSRINLRAGLSFGKLAGADSLSESEELRSRNLSFQSNIAELSFIGEFNTFDMSVKRWSPYVFAGLAIFRHNPFTFDNAGNKVFLQPLSTEGQGLPGYPQRNQYALTQLAIPFGGGIKFNVSNNFRVALEVGLRKLFTDYLDDLSGNYADPADLLANRGPLAVELSYRGDEVPTGDPAYPLKGAQRGSPKYKDYYYFSGLHLTFLFPDNGKKSGLGCPKF
jgi:hypothetical protein